MAREITLKKSDLIDFFKSNVAKVKDSGKNLQLKLKPYQAMSSVYFKNFWVFVYILFFIALSQLSLRHNTDLGIYMNGLATAALVGMAMIYDKAWKLALSVSILPIATMISLAIPGMSNFVQTVIFYDSLLVLGLIYRYLFIFDAPPEKSKMKLQSYIIFVPLMLILGQLLGLVGYGMLRHHYPFGGTSLALVAVSVGVFAFTEETFFRGLIQRKGSQVLHPYFAALLTVLIYSLSTIDHLTILAPLFALILGAVLCLTYYLKQNLVLTGVLNLATKLGYIFLMAAFVFKKF